MKASSKWCWALLATAILVPPGLGQTTSSDAQTSPPPVALTTTNSNSTEDTPAPAPADPQPLPMPSMSGPLQTAIPHTFEAGPFGKLAVTGVISGMGLTQGNGLPGDKTTHWDVSNAQIFIQKTTGWWQFYLQAGAYNLPALGTPFLSTGNTVTNIYGPFPQGYLKLVKGNFNVEVGALPVFTYLAKSSAKSDTFFDHGGWFSPSP